MTGVRLLERILEKKHWLLFGGGIVLFSGYYFLEDRKEEEQAYESFSTFEEEGGEIGDEVSGLSGQDEEENLIMMVDVKGAVKNPGVYLVTAGERVVDVLAKAGGLTEDADDAKINLSQKVIDEMVIFVPRKGEELDSIVSFPAIAGGGSANDDRKININTADREELQALPGIGPAKADAIIEYRESNGPFQKIEDIMNVSGIGEKSFEKLQERITVK